MEKLVQLLARISEEEALTEINILNKCKDILDHLNYEYLHSDYNNVSM